MAPHARLIIILSCIVAAIVFASLSLGSCNNQHGSGSGAGSEGNKKTERVTIAGHAFDLEVAADPSTRAIGLMNRASIDEHGGMIFIFPDKGVQVQGFWMKNCLADLDIIYLDSRGKVTATHHMLAETPKQASETQASYEQRLKRYSSGYPAQFAIELKAGWLEQLHLKLEDPIAIDLERLKAMAR